ncbi:hypothetical protein ACFPK3_17110, partial [Brachybacterium alimentarium]|uniref:hypothetical protein n=1 Tax=Brachybacterium alimentarium TaxID=47845 RepID=UPI0036189976
MIMQIEPPPRAHGRRPQENGMYRSWAQRRRNLSTFLGHLLSFVVEFAGGVFSSWSGGLIQAVVGNAGGTGW